MKKVVMKNEATWNLSRYLTFIFALVGIAALLYGVVLSPSSNRLIPNVSAQQDPFLAQRLTQIESRFNSLEARLNRLESESRLTAISPRITENNDADVRQLQNRVDNIGLRLMAVECGLIKLDERTLNASARQRRKNTGKSIDRCRLEPNSPLELIEQP